MNSFSAAQALLTVLRHIVAIAALPFVMAVLIPANLLRRNTHPFAVGTNATELFLQLIGVLLLCLGGLFFVWSLRRFAVDGAGTLAPWDPPRRLVVQGPYRHVRNPMISGVMLVIIGEALVLRSPEIAWWSAIFFTINSIYIPLLEEPQLKNRFGADYEEYRSHVPRLIPRTRPWTPPVRSA